MSASDNLSEGPGRSQHSSNPHHSASWGGTTAFNPTIPPASQELTSESSTVVASSARPSLEVRSRPRSIDEAAASYPDRGHMADEGNPSNPEDYHGIRPSGWQSFRRSWKSKGLLRPGRLLWLDLRNIRTRYASDWTTFNQLVFASAVYTFFTNLLPGITFANDLYNLTGQTWGTIEVIFSTGLCGVVFALFSSQPLTILGVTGPFSVLAETMYTVCTSKFDIAFLPFMAWSLIHACWMHALLAVFNAHDWTMLYVTTFSTEIFSLLNSIIYFHKAIQVLERLKESSGLTAFLYGVIGAAGTFLLAVVLSSAERWDPIFHRIIRLGLREYAAAISIILWIGIPNIGELTTIAKEQLAISTQFRPSDPSRSRFFVPFWELPARWVGAAIVPGIIITMLFFFDHEVSSIICTGKRYGTKKPGGFAWDIVLLGITTAVCGILGIPPANGLLPQAPLHSESLRYLKTSTHDREDGDRSTTGGTEDPRATEEEITPHIYEQRWSPFLQAGAILLFLSPPFMHVLGLTPTSVLAGLFLFMGEQSLQVNPVLRRFLYIFSDPAEIRQHATWRKSSLERERAEPICDLCDRRIDHKRHSYPDTDTERPSKSRPGYLRELQLWLPVHAYTITQIVVTAGIFATTLTAAAPCFPLIIFLLVPIRLILMNRIWSREILRAVDAWACREGTPEDTADQKKELIYRTSDVRMMELGAVSPSIDRNHTQSDIENMAVRSRRYPANPQAPAKSKLQLNIAK